MTRRIVTAREQVEMLAPWREGAYYTEDDMRYGPPPDTRPVVVSPDGSVQELRDWVRQAKWDDPGTKCEYCKSAPTHAIKHSEGMAYIQTCDKHLAQGKKDCEECTPDGTRDPSNINTVKRIAVWREHPWLDDKDTGTYTDPMDPTADIATYLRGPEDAYDEYDNGYGDWEQRVHDHPPDPTPTDVDWYHATYVDLPVGTVLAPHKGKVPWLDNPYHGGLDNRANWTWVEYDISHSDEWLGYMVRDHGEGHLYRVKPHIGPFPWNGDAREGWVTDYAVIVERVQDAGGQQRAAASMLDSVNPTGSLFVDYDPTSRTGPIAPHLTTLDKAKGVHPDEPVMIYRGAPAHQNAIVPGDFVTTNPQLAREYAGQGRVLQKSVPHSHVVTDPDEWEGEEHIYRPHIARVASDEVKVRQQ